MAQRARSLASATPRSARGTDAPCSGTFLAIGAETEWTLAMLVTRALEDVTAIVDSDLGGESDILASTANALERWGMQCMLEIDRVRYGTGLPEETLVTILRVQAAHGEQSLRPIWWSQDEALQPFAFERAGRAGARGLRASGFAWMLTATVRHGSQSFGWLTAFGTDLGEAASSVLIAVEAARLLGASLAVRRAREERDALAARGERALAVVAHELKNPLAIVLTNARLCRAGVGSGLDANVVERHAARALILVHDILESTAMRHAPTLETTVCDALGLVREAIELTQPLASASGLRLEEVTDGDLPAVRANPDRIAQVLVNLIGNATKFTPRGGRVAIGATTLRTHVAFHVTDTGPGITPDLADKVFEPFWHADPDRGGGTGLGLTIARDIVHAHDGRIWAENAPGSGARFVFTVPRAGAAP